MSQVHPNDHILTIDSKATLSVLNLTGFFKSFVKSEIANSFITIVWRLNNTGCPSSYLKKFNYNKTLK
jgi:hypothetical protein